MKLYAELGRRVASRRRRQRHGYRGLFRVRHRQRDADRDHYTGELLLKFLSLRATGLVFFFLCLKVT